MTNIQVNQRLSIILDTPEGEKSILSYVREVYPDRLVLTRPQDWEENIAYLEEGEEIRTKLFTRIGVLLYTAVILNSPADDAFTIEYNEDFAQILQRRAYTRVALETVVDCSYDELVKAEIVNNGNKDNFVEYSAPLSCEFEKKVVEAETVDIGGGGLRIKTKEDLPRQKTITFKINLFDDIIIAKGVIVENNNLPEHQYGVQFTQISDEDRNKIIKTCFKIDAIINRKTD